MKRLHTDRCQRLAFSASAAVLLANIGNAATNYYWDSSDSSGLQGVSGTWKRGVVNWNPAADGTSSRVAWPLDDTSQDANAIFTVASTAATIDGTVRTHGVEFGASSIVIAGGIFEFATTTVNLYVPDAGYSGSISAQISGANGPHLSGQGTVTLSGTNNYSGSALVASGTLVVNGNQTAATGNLTVNSGGRLAGSGTIGADTTTVSGLHSAGEPVSVTGLGAIGRQSFVDGGVGTADLVYASGSVFEWQLDRTKAQVVGTGYDGVVVEGGVSLSGATDAVFRIAIGDATFGDVFWQTSRSWADIFTDGSNAPIGGWTGVFATGGVSNFEFYNLSGQPVSPAGYGAFSMSGNTLTWTAVPEPSAALGGLLVVAGALRRRRG